jgi:hypothetical protein
LAAGLSGFVAPPLDPSAPDPLPAPPLSELALEPEPPSPVDASLALVAVDEDDRAEELRSFFAQPLPLKWIDGAENALRTGDAPHTGHASGPVPDTEWITSKRCPFGQR